MLVGSGVRSTTMLVVAAVPLLFHNSFPLMPSSAEKTSVPLKLVRLTIEELSGPVRISFTSNIENRNDASFKIGGQELTVR